MVRVGVLSEDDELARIVGPNHPGGEGRASDGAPRPRMMPRPTRAHRRVARTTTRPCGLRLPELELNADRGRKPDVNTEPGDRDMGILGIVRTDGAHRVDNLLVQDLG